MRKLAAALSVAAGSLLILCQPGCGPSAAKVSGKVSCNGKAVVWGTVNLQSQDGTPFQAQIQPDGTYVCERVPRGKYSVMVFSPDPFPAPAKKKGVTPQAEKMLSEKQNLREKWFPIPTNYSDHTTSGLFVEVDQSPKQYDIPLKNQD